MQKLLAILKDPRVSHTLAVVAGAAIKAGLAALLAMLGK